MSEYLEFGEAMKCYKQSVWIRPCHIYFLVYISSIFTVFIASLYIFLFIIKPYWNWPESVGGALRAMSLFFFFFFLYSASKDLKCPGASVLNLLLSSMNSGTEISTNVCFQSTCRVPIITLSFVTLIFNIYG